MKNNKNIDEIIRQKLKDIDYTSQPSEVEKIHQFVSANQHWWLKYSWVKSVGYLAAASVLVASLAYNLIQYQNNVKLENTITKLDALKAEQKLDNNLKTNSTQNELLSNQTTVKNENINSENIVDSKPTDNQVVVENKKNEDIKINTNSIKHKNSEKEFNGANKEQKSVQNNKITKGKGQNNFTPAAENITIERQNAEKNTGNIAYKNTAQPEDLNKNLISNENVEVNNTITPSNIEQTTSEQLQLTEIATIENRDLMPLEIKRKKIEGLEYYIPSPYKIKTVKKHQMDIRAGLVYEADRFSNSIGLNGEYLINGKWGISTGFQTRIHKALDFRNLDHFKSENGKEFGATFPNHGPGGPNEPKIRDIRFRESNFEIPLNVNYYYHLSKSHALFASVGSKLVLGVRKVANYKIEPQNPSPNDAVVNIKEYENNFTLNNFNVGIGYEFDYKKFAFQVAPKIEFSKVGNRRFESPLNLGIQAKIFYIF